MEGFIRIGDSAASGGAVLEKALSLNFYGVGVARNRRPIAFDRHTCECGRALVSSLPMTVAS